MSKEVFLSDGRNIFVSRAKDCFSLVSDEVSVLELHHFESPIAFTGMCKPQTHPEIHLQTALEDVRWLPCHHFSFPDERLLCSSKIKEDK